MVLPQADVKAMDTKGNLRHNLNIDYVHAIIVTVPAHAQEWGIRPRERAETMLIIGHTKQDATKALELISETKIALFSTIDPPSNKSFIDIVEDLHAPILTIHSGEKVTNSLVALLWFTQYLTPKQTYQIMTLIDQWCHSTQHVGFGDD